MFGALPVIAPGIKPNTLGFGDPVVAVRRRPTPTRPVRPDCPLLMPIDIGTSILLSAPGLLLALFAAPAATRPASRSARALRSSLIALFNLAHFSQGWVQWGYRFSLDFIPFLLPLVALGAARVDGRPRGDRRRCW